MKEDAAPNSLVTMQTRSNMSPNKVQTRPNQIKQEYFRKLKLSNESMLTRDSKYSATFKKNKKLNAKKRWISPNEDVKATKASKYIAPEIKLQTPSQVKSDTLKNGAGCDSLDAKLSDSHNGRDKNTEAKLETTHARRSWLNNSTNDIQEETKDQINEHNTFLTEFDHEDDIIPSTSKEAWVTGNNDNEFSPQNIVQVIPSSIDDTVAVSDSDDYDTDLEDGFPEPIPEPFDTYGIKKYKKECASKDLVPIKYLMNRLHETKLQMRHHGLGVKGSIAVSKALMNNLHLVEIDLSDNHIQTEGGFAFVDMLYENQFITDLTLSDNGLLAEVGISFGQLLLVNKTLKRLVLKGNKFTDRVAKSFAEALKVNLNLELLDLSYNEFSERGGLYLGAGLALNGSLRSLNLKWNSVRVKGAVSIAAALKKNECLTELDLSWNGISFVGCLAFGRHLKHNVSLKVLNISNNRVGPNGASKIATGLASHPCMEVFKIGLNPIGDEGVVSILKATQRNTSLKIIGLEDITVSHTTYKMIRDLENSRDINIVTGGLGGYSKGKPAPSGMDVLVQFIQDNRMRLTDLFFQWDKDKSGDISKEEFYQGLLETGLKMDEHQLRNLIEQIDDNKDGLIDFSEITAGRRTVILERRFKKKVAVRTEERENDSIKLPKIKGF